MVPAASFLHLFIIWPRCIGCIAGFATFLFDLLSTSEAEDRHNVFDIPLLASRLQLAVEWLEVTHKLPTDFPVGFFGASTGGQVDSGDGQLAVGVYRVTPVLCFESQLQMVLTACKLVLLVLSELTYQHAEVILLR